MLQSTPFHQYSNQIPIQYNIAELYPGLLRAFLFVLVCLHGDSRRTRTLRLHYIHSGDGLRVPYTQCVCVCVFFPFILDIKFVGRTSRGHTGFFIHLLSAVRAYFFLARRIQPFPSLVGREVEFCVLTIESFSTRWAFLFLFFK